MASTIAGNYVEDPTQIIENRFKAPKTTTARAKIPAIPTSVPAEEDGFSPISNNGKLCWSAPGQ
jgi:hypothetical protein